MDRRIRRFIMKYLILAILSLLLFSCGNGGNENSGKQDEGIGGVLSSEYGQLKIKSEDCGLNYENKMREISIYFTTYYPTRVATTLENEKYISCRTNIEALNCESDAVVNFDLLTVPDCLFYENTEGFPTGKNICESRMNDFCHAPRYCVDGVSCDPFSGEKPFRQTCAESGSDTGAYTCTGDYNNAPFCKPFWVEYTSGCHDKAGYVKENSFDDLCDKFGDVLLIEDDSVVEQFDACYNARPHSFEDLYDINYDISTITECQFIFAE